MQVLSNIKTNFDKYIWRLNGVIILVIGIAGLIGILMMVYKLFSSTTALNPAVVQVNNETKKVEHLNLGYFDELSGTDYVLVALKANEFEKDMTFINSYSGKSKGGETKNYLLYNTKTEEELWIWEENKVKPINYILVTLNRLKAKAKTLGVIFEFVEKDSNADGVKDYNDERSLIYLDLKDKKQYNLGSAHKRIIDHRFIPPNKVMIFYSDIKKAFVKSFDIESKKLSEPKILNFPK